MIKYLNWNGETIDELDSDDFPNMEAFEKECDRLQGEYSMAGMNGEWSNRELI